MWLPRLYRSLNKKQRQRLAEASKRLKVTTKKVSADGKVNVSRTQVWCYSYNVGYLVGYLSSSEKKHLNSYQLWLIFFVGAKEWRQRVESNTGVSKSFWPTYMSIARGTDGPASAVESPQIENHKNLCVHLLSYGTCRSPRSSTCGIWFASSLWVLSSYGIQKTWSTPAARSEKSAICRPKSNWRLWEFKNVLQILLGALTGFWLGIGWHVVFVLKCGLQFIYHLILDLFEGKPSYWLTRDSNRNAPVQFNSCQKPFKGVWGILSLLFFQSHHYHQK